jgi:osmotically-inducible protein OsmY
MPRFGKWLLTLGLMAATPAAVVSAGPFDSPAPAKPAAANKNQQVAENIAKALRDARLNRFEMDVEFANGVCTLSGKVGTPQQREQANQVVSRVKGVTRVVNRLQPMSSPAPTVKNAGYNAGNRRVQRTAATGTAPSNQQMAEAIAKSLKSAGLAGYDMEIRYQNGTVHLSGAIASPQQAIRVEQVISRVPGVRGINNQLKVTTPNSQRQAMQQRPMQQGPMQQGPMQRQPIQQAAWQNGPNGGGIPAPMAYMHGGPGAQQAVYNNPNLPDYSFPTYGSYPNSASISYPKQYSASAWPYIGPFYPYPQVPMGWRKATLEWDDGYWALNFNSRTDRWWWFMNPKNW